VCNSANLVLYVTRAFACRENTPNAILNQDREILSQTVFEHVHGRAFVEVQEDVQCVGSRHPGSTCKVIIFFLASYSISQLVVVFVDCELSVTCNRIQALRFLHG
jgi:hypothetical protein